MCTVLSPISENDSVLLSGIVLLTRPIKVQVKNTGVHFLFRMCRFVMSTSFFLYRIMAYIVCFPDV